MVPLVLAMYPHVKTIDRCHVVLEPAPKAERDKLLAAARARFGKTARIEATFLGTEIQMVTFEPELPLDVPAAKSLSETELSARAAAYVRANADLFGIAGEIDQLGAMKVHEWDPGQYQATAQLHRASYGMPDMVFINVNLTDLGAISFVGVNGLDVPPEFPLCDKPTLAADDPKIIKSVLAEELWYGTLDGKVSLGKVARDEIKLVKPIVDSVARPPAMDSNPFEYARGFAVYAQHVEKEKPSNLITWEFLVDGETGKVLGTWRFADLPAK